MRAINRASAVARAVGVALLALMLASGAVLARLARGETTLGSYATSLRGRTVSQAFNARRSARALHGAWIRPGGVFSFNHRVGPWNAAAGYHKAPVSYDGDLVRAYGGGVCQTSTTLYNAALLAGLEVVERHRHLRPPAYVAPGRDAAVALPDVDLRLQNPYPDAVRIEARCVGESLVISIRGRGPRRPVVVRTEVTSVARPLSTHPLLPNTCRQRATNGHRGFSAVTYRAVTGRPARVLSYDAYAPASEQVP